MVHYKLTYFNGRGAAETIRQVFALAGQDYEDNRIERDVWANLKPSTPFGQLPVLEVDGKQLAQSYAITRYLAKQFGVAGKSAWEEAEVDALGDQWKDFTNEIRPFFMVLLKFAEGDLDKLKADVFAPAAAKHLQFYENALKKNGTGFLVGSSATWVDLLVAEGIAMFHEKSPEALENFPLASASNGYFGTTIPAYAPACSVLLWAEPQRRGIVGGASATRCSREFCLTLRSVPVKGGR